MHLRAPAIVCSLRSHGESGAIARLFTCDHGMVAAYVAGGRGRQHRPVLIPGNVVDAELKSRSGSQMPFARIELLQSRGPWLSEPLPAAAMGWVTALTATVLPERHAYPALHQAMSALLAFDRIGRALVRYPLAERRSDVMAARAMLRARLARIES